MVLAFKGPFIFTISNIDHNKNKLFTSTITTNKNNPRLVKNEKKPNKGLTKTKLSVPPRSKEIFIETHKKKIYVC